MKIRQLLLFFGCSGLALAVTLSVIDWKPARAAAPGAAGAGVVNPAFGSYGDSIDIQVPDYYDLEPDIKLVYSSGNGNDIAGVGWGLNVDSYIERISPGGGAPTYTANDTFVLDGSELLANTSLGGTHCTKHQSFQRIQQDTANNKWYIWDKDGKKSTYTALYLVNSSTFRWGLSTVQDTSGNTVTYNYWTDPGQNCYLDNISYNGYSIKFWREVRPDPISFANGVSWGSTNYRLKTIEVKVGVSRARAYKLSYVASGNSHRSLLTSVQEFGNDAVIDASGNVTGGTSLPALMMNYNPGGVGYPTSTQKDIGAWDTRYEDLDGDVDGDGKDDHVRIWETGGNAWVQTLLSNGSGYPTTTSNTLFGGWNAIYRDYLVDVNGDGRADLVRIWQKNGNEAWAQVNLSNGTGFPSTTSNVKIGGWNTAYEYHFGDVNGDGKADLVCIWLKNGNEAWAQTLLSDGNGYPTTTSNALFGGWNTTFKDSLVDVNGDGKIDLVRIWSQAGRSRAQVNLSNGTGFPTTSSNLDIGAWDTDNKDTFVDINGDGKADLVRIWKKNTTEAWAQVSLSNGISFAESSNVKVGGWGATVMDFLADANGDGRPDVIRIWNNGGTATAQVNFFDGLGYGTVSSNAQIGTFDTTWKYSFNDVDGDGRADLVRIWGSGGRALAKVFLAASAGGPTPPDLLTSITNGLGGSTTIAYVPSSDWPSQYTSRGGNFPTVEQVVVSDGRGHSGTTIYSYANAQFSPADKAFLGFRFQEAVVDDQGTYVETYNRQTVQSTGQADSIYTKNNTGQVFGYTTFSYAEGGNGTTVPYSSQVSATSEFELNLGTTGRENRSTFSYDSYGNQTQITYQGDVAVIGDEFIKVIAYNYNPALYLVENEKSEQKYSGTTVVAANKVDESIYFYDGATSSATLPTKGILTRTDSWNNQTGGYVSASAMFDSYGNEISSTDTRGATSTTVYDGVYHQHPIQSTNALGQTTSGAWDYVKGVVLSTTSANGATSIFTYDALGRSTSVTDPAGQVTTTTYLAIGDPNNQRVKKTVPDGSADGLWTETYTDGLGRNYKTVREGASAGVSYIKEAVYNDADQYPQQVSLWYQSGSTPKWESFQYDGAGRMIRTTHADGSFATVAYTLDSAGKPCTITTDELGHQRTVWINTTEQVTRVMEKNGSVYYDTYRTYDAEGHLLQVTDANGNQTTYSYNSLNQNISTNDMNIGIVTNTYDAGALLLTEIDAKGQTTTFTYDILGRAKTATAGGQTTSYYYDESGYGASVGQLTRVVYPAGSESYVYNNLGQVTTLTKSIGAVTKAMVSTYDTIGRAKTVTYPDGEVVTYGYAADGNLASVSGYVTGMVYGPNGELTQLTYANGTTSTYAYDANRLWLNTASVQKGGTTLYAGAYTYNAAQLVTSMTQATPTPQVTTYTYDDLNRLLSVGGAQNQTFSYDAVGNVTTNSLKGSYTYGNSAHKHAVTSAGASTYTYDANGNMLTGNGKTFGWDAQDRLASVTQGSSVTSFLYGAGHDRLQKTQGANTTLYFNEAIEQTNGSSIQYYYAGCILVAKKDAAGTKTWYHADRLGSIRLMTNAAGAEVKDYDYRPFGEVLSSSGSMSNERGFTGQIADAETGLMYFNARYYDANLGRFISADTQVQAEDDPQDLNAYSYCGNNPVNNIDPTGHVRVFAGMQRYLSWSKTTVTKTITIKIPYIIVYPTFQFYWNHVSVSKTISWWAFGWHRKTISVSVSVPATRVIWHTKAGYHTFQRTIRFTVMVPHVHYRTIYRTITRHIAHRVGADLRSIARSASRAGRGVATAAKATGHFVAKHRRAIVTTLVIVAVVAAVVATGGGAGVLLGAGGGARLLAGGVNAAAAVAFGIMNDESAGTIARNAAIQGGLGFATVGVGQYIGGSTKAAQAVGLGRKAGFARDFGLNMGFSFIKDTTNNYASGKTLKGSVVAAGKGAALGGVLTGGILASPGGFENKIAIGGAGFVGNVGGQFLLAGG